MKKRIISLILAILIVFCLIPATGIGIIANAAPNAGNMPPMNLGTGGRATQKYYIGKIGMLQLQLANVYFTVQVSSPGTLEFEYPVATGQYGGMRTDTNLYAYNENTDKYDYIGSSLNGRPTQTYECKNAGLYYFYVTLNNPPVEIDLSVSFSGSGGGASNTNITFLQDVYNVPVGVEKNIIANFTSDTLVPSTETIALESSYTFEEESKQAIFFSNLSITGTKENADISFNIKSDLEGLHKIFIKTSDGYDFSVWVLVGDGYYIRAFSDTPTLEALKQEKNKNGDVIVEGKRYYVTFCLYNLDKIADETPQFTFAIADNSIAKILSTYPNEGNVKNICVEIQAKDPGVTYLSVTELVTGKQLHLPITTLEKQNKFRFDEIKPIHESGNGDTYFYDIGGICIDDFSFEKLNNNDKFYKVNFTVYNRYNTYGMVISYDKNGNVYDFVPIDRHSQGEHGLQDMVDNLGIHLWDNLQGAIGGITFNKWEYYKAPLSSKKTLVLIEVPVDGYLEITNDATKPEVYLYNSLNCDILIAKSAHKIISKNVDSDIKIVNKIVDKIGIDILKEVANSATKNLTKKGIEQQIIDFNHEMEKRGINDFPSIVADILKEEGLIENAVVSVMIDSIEKWLLDADATGKMVKALMSVTKELSINQFFMTFINNPAKGQSIELWPPLENGSNTLVTNGIQVTQNSNFDNDVILSVQKIRISDDLVNLLGFPANATNSKEYEIALYKNNVKTQPDSKVTVRIPVPDSFDPNGCEVYHLVNGKWVAMKAKCIDGMYLEFETDSFSNFAVVELGATIQPTTKPNSSSGGSSSGSNSTNTPSLSNKATRIYGENRIETAIEVSKTGWTKSDNIILASSLNFPDALAGGALACMLDAPILLTKGTTATIESNVLNQMSALGAKNIYILGGESVISSDIFNQLKTLGYNIERLSGNDRYETSIAIAKKMDEIRGSAPEFIFVADGLNYADALSVTPVAGIKGMPIIFTPNNKVGFNAVSADYSSKCGTKKAVILGGTVAVKSDVETKLIELGFTFDRVYGSDRYETSANIYITYKSLFTGDKALMATGRDFPDALSGGALGGKLKSPLFLVNGVGATSTPIKSAVDDMSPNNVYVLGGSGVVTDMVVNNHIG